MIATYQHLVAVEPTQYMQEPSVDHNIAQMVDLVVRAHTVVPGPDHELVHFLC